MDPESARLLTVKVIVLTTVFLVLYDVAIVWLAGVDASISVVLYEESRKHPAIAGAALLVVGHIWWPSRDGPVNR